MKIETQLLDDGSTLQLTLGGQFDYTCHQPFQAAYESTQPLPNKILIDVLDLVSIDSSALGMLLLLRDHAGGEEAHIEIVNASANVYKLMCSCNFDELFTITPYT